MIHALPLIRDKLLADADLLAFLKGPRIYAFEAAQLGAFPDVVVYPLGSNSWEGENLDQAAPPWRQVYSAACRSQHPEEAWDVGELVLAALNAWRGVAGEAMIHDTRPIGDNMVTNDEAGIYSRVLDFRLFLGPA